MRSPIFAASVGSCFLTWDRTRPPVLGAQSRPSPGPPGKCPGFASDLRKSGLSPRHQGLPMPGRQCECRRVCKEAETRCWDACSDQAAGEESANSARPQKPPPARPRPRCVRARPPISPPFVGSSVGPLHLGSPLPNSDNTPSSCFTRAQTETSDPRLLSL